MIPLNLKSGKMRWQRKPCWPSYNFNRHQRANSPEELKADEHLLLYGSTNTVDLRGGWCDASGDVSKYFSHLAYANFMSPQQTPLVVWSMVNTVDTAASLLERLNAKEPLMEEALYGADYMMRSLSAGELLLYDGFQLL